MTISDGASMKVCQAEKSRVLRKGAWKSESQTIVNNPYDFDSATGGLALCFTDVIIFNGHTI